MRVLFLVAHPREGPSSRFRVYQYLPFLREHSVEATVRPFLSSHQAPVIYGEGRAAAKVGITAWSTLRRLADLAVAPRYDLVYVLREAFPFGPPVLERLFRAASGRLVFDFDDAIYLRSLAYDNPLDRLRDWDKAAKLIRLAAHVVAGSRYLRDYASRFQPDARCISVLPTVVDTRVYRPAGRRRRERPLTIGWIGTPRGSSYLRVFVPVMRDLVARFDNLRFTFVGAAPFAVDGLPVTFKTWSLNDEVADLQSFDIGIMPLTDDEETRGKCGFKLIQYMSVGVPVVCSPVGANLDIVDDGVTGFFAARPEEWTGRLAALVNDAALREAQGAAGRERVVRDYSLAAAAPRMLGILRDVAGK